MAAGPPLGGGLIIQVIVLVVAAGALAYAYWQTGSLLYLALAAGAVAGLGMVIRLARMKPPTRLRK